MKKLPVEEQDRFAAEVLDRLDEEREWDRLVSSPASVAWLEEASNKALYEYRQGKTLKGDPAD